MNWLLAVGTAKRNLRIYLVYRWEALMKRGMKHGVCRLCLEEAMLQNSHIFPKSVSKPIRGDKGHMLEITGEGRYGTKLRQDGYKEHLLCSACETFCNDEYEKPFNATWQSIAPTNPWKRGQVIQAKVDYVKFKLFHLLNLFRASISTLPELAGVQLGPHEDVLRKMILKGDAGNSQRYAVAGLVLYSQVDGSLLEANFHPKRMLRERRTSYTMFYLNTEWIVLISDGGAEKVRRLALQEDGTLMLTGHPWQQHPIRDEIFSRIADKEVNPSP